MPEADARRLLVDGMNVIGSRPDGWWRDRHAAMARLVELLDRYADETGESVAVVFERPPRPPIPSEAVAVLSAPEARPNAADDEIVRIVEADSDPSGLTVVTSDRDLVSRVRALGAEIESAASFRRRLERD